MQPVTLKEMILDLLNEETNIICYLKDNDDNFHKVSEATLFEGKIKCEDGYYDYNEYILEDEGIDDRLFSKLKR